MSGLVMRYFAPSDLDYIIPRPHDAAMAEAMRDSKERIVAQADMGPAWTGEYGGVPLFCGGIVRLWPGVGEGWLYAGEGISAHRLSFHRTAWLWMVRMCREERLHRLQVSVAAENDGACRWIRRLGFVEEGRMEKYGPDGSAFVRYATFPGAWGAA